MYIDKKDNNSVTAVIMLLILLMFMLVSCEQNIDHLLYQDYPFRVLADAEIDSFLSSVQITMQNPNSGTVSYFLPQTLEGVTFQFGEDGIFMSYDDIKLPFTAKADADFLILLQLFSLKEDEFAGARPINSGNKNGLNCAEFKTDAGNITVYTDSGGLPQKISAVLYGHNVEISVTEFEYLETP